MAGGLRTRSLREDPDLLAGRWEAAIARLALDASDPIAAFGWGHALFRANRPEEALAPLQHAAASDPTWVEAHLALGEVFFKLGRSEEALGAWFRVKGVASPSGDLRSLEAQDLSLQRWQAEATVPLEASSALVNLGEHLLGEMRFEEAFAVWERLFTLRPEDAGVHKRFTAAFLFCGRVAEADQIYQSRVDLSRAEAKAKGLDALGVRFLRDFTTHVGHIGFLDYYIKLDQLGERSKDRPVVLHGRKPVANPAYLRCWEDYLPHVIADPQVYGQLEPLIDPLEDHTHGVLDHQDRQVITYTYRDYVRVFGRWEAEGRSPLLRLSDAQMRAGEACLREMGLPEEAWFVTLHVRENQWDKVRNGRITDYVKAINAITDRGGWVIRMGDTSMTPLQPQQKVIDYAFSPWKSDAMDVFLWAQNRFHLGTNSGPYQVPPTFGKPCVLTNWAPLLTPPMYPQDLCIYKRYVQNGKVLTFDELISSGIGLASSATYLDHIGVSLVDSTPEEICEATVEMMERLEGREPLRDEAIQASWKQTMAPLGGANGVLGTAFAKRHAELFRI
jgi:putative glycosyltransferase (TIGR04372 family)